jgi:hypothetical protein
MGVLIMAANFDAEDALEDITASWPRDHFRGAERLLLAYVARLAESAALLDGCEQRQSDFLLRIETHLRSLAVFEEALEMAEALGLLPGDDGQSRPWLQ